MEHIFRGCALGVQPNPFGGPEEEFQYIILNQQTGEVWRYPISRENLAGMTDEQKKLLGAPVIELPGAATIHKVQNGREKLN